MEEDAEERASSYLHFLPYVIGSWIHIAMLFPFLGPVFSAFPGPGAPAGWPCWRQAGAVVLRKETTQLES